MIETKFKDSELGPIPIDWEIRPLCDFGAFSKGKGISRDESHTGCIPAIRYGEIYTNHNNYVIDYTSHISLEVAKQSKEIKYGDVLFTASGETKEEIGKAVAIVNHTKAFAGGDIIILSLNKDVSPMLCGFLANFSTSVRQKALLGQGDAVVHISSKSIGSILIAIPSQLYEQERIAEALSDVDALIKELDALIEKKRMVLKATMQDLLTARRRLPGFSEPWQEVKLGNIGVLIRGVSFNPGQCYITQISNTIPILRSNNIQLDQINLSSLIYVDKNCVNHNQYILNEDILICSANGSERLVGKSAFMDNLNGFSFGAFMMVFRCFNTCVSKYISFYMRTDSYKLQIKDLLCGSAINNLNASQLDSIKINLPTSLSEQQAIAGILSDMDAEIAELEKKKEKYASIRQGMMQQLLTGKIRLL